MALDARPGVKATPTTSKRRLGFMARSRVVEALQAYLFLLPAAAILFTFQYLTAIDVFRISLTNRLLLRPTAKFIGVVNYVRLWNDGRFGNVNWNTFYFLAASEAYHIALARHISIE